MNQDMVDKAYALAHDEIADGQNRVMVLFPSRQPSSVRCREEGIFTRYSDEPNSLMSLAIDTLITVGDAKEFSKKGFDYIWDRMRASVNTKVILLTDDWPCFSKTGASDESV